MTHRPSVGHQRLRPNLRVIVISGFLLTIVFLVQGNSRTGLSYKPGEEAIDLTHLPPDWGVYQIYWGPDHFPSMLHRSLVELADTPDYIMFYRDLGRPFPSRGCAIVRDRGALPVISLELWTWGRNPGNVLPRIANGGYDDFFLRYAQDAKAYGDSVVLRFGFEMNGDWFTWGNQPEVFVTAWKRIHGMFEEEGADNVIWAWTPNNVSIPRTRENRIELYYPGDDFVDWVGIDGYNFGDHHDQWHSWETFDEVFTPALKLFDEKYASKPILLAEFGSAPGDEGQKAAWIRDAYEKISAHPRILGAIWYNFDKRREGEPNWKISSDVGSLDAFNETFAMPGP